MTRASSDPLISAVWRILWALWFVIVLLATTFLLAKFDGHPHWSRVEWVPFSDFIFTQDALFETTANVLLFVPFGYLTVRILPRTTRRPVLIAVFLGFLCSAGAELYQLFCDYRVSSTTDLLTNGVGTLVGAQAAMWITRVMNLVALRSRPT